MRLDGPGKPPLVQSNQVLNLITEKARRQLVDKVTSPDESYAPTEESMGGQKLAQILDILSRSRDRKDKKKQLSLQSAKVIGAYKNFIRDEDGLGGEEPRPGQILNIKA